MRKSSVASLFAMAVFASSAQAGDIEKGKVLADTCMGCHGIPGYTNAYPGYRVPRLGGQHPAYIVAALKGYRDGSRNHPTMNGHAAMLDEKSMEDIAAYLSTAPAK